jgi:hypothetical protein
LVNLHNLHTFSKPNPQTLRFADGRTQLCDKRCRVKIKIGDYETWIECEVAPIHHDLILGIPWLQQENPRIDWRKREISFSHRGKSILIDCFHPNSHHIQLITALELQETLLPEDQIFLINLESQNAEDTYYDDAAKKLIKEFEMVFQELPKRLPRERHVDHKIDLLPGSKPPAFPHYRLAPAELEELKKQLDELMEKGHIRPSKSPFAAPVLFVKKKDGTLRLCVDYRALKSEFTRCLGLRNKQKKKKSKSKKEFLSTKTTQKRIPVCGSDALASPLFPLAFFSPP